MEEKTTVDVALEALSTLACLQWFEQHEGQVITIELWRDFKRTILGGLDHETKR